MPKKAYSFLLVLLCWFAATIAHAQKADSAAKEAMTNRPGVTDSTTHTQLAAAPEKVEMADRLRADGKIYIVVLVLGIVLLGLIGYVTRLDRKISRLEKEAK